jgi:Protein of unknown function (DUF2752)
VQLAKNTAQAASTASRVNWGLRMGTKVWRLRAGSACWYTVMHVVQLVLPQRNRTFGALDALALVGLMGFALARWVPIATLVPFWGCGFRKLTGIPCPGCGLTRVADRVAHLNVLGAFAANPLGTVAALVFAVAIVASALHLAFRVPVPQLLLDEREWKWVRWGSLGLFALNYAWVIFAHTMLHWR